MCFSSNASFAASAALAAVGMLALRAARWPATRLYASIPLLFAVQQAIEGALWLGFERDAAGLDAVLAHTYVLFSHVLWPAYVPLAVMSLETVPWRRRALGFVTLMGTVVAVWLMVATSFLGVAAWPVGGHIEYVTTSRLAHASTALYLLAVGAGLLLSSGRWVRTFGVCALASFAVVEVFYETWMISVWCFCAALLSTLVYLHVRSEAHPSSAAAASGTSAATG